MNITKDTVVTLRFELLNSDGESIENSGSLLSYLHGGYAGIFPMVEETLEGKRAGDAFSVSLEPADAFGDYDEHLIRIEPREVFPGDLQVGMQFEGVPQGEEDDRWVVYTVTDIAEDKVVVDGNHPLAGERLLFKGVVAEVRAATQDEIHHGHAHGDHGHVH
ncbi:MAG: peptidylprolyl isomerase [Betaproteobacteria bacterium]|nr:peptidylprolyl isomerase [Betaproteobacteria bacterium]